MIYDLRPYPSMKDTGVPWLGEVPENWEAQRGKWLFRHKKEINSDRRHTNILSLTLRGVVNNDPDDPEGLVPKDYGTYQFFRKNDLVFKLIDLENLRTSRVGLVHEDGIMSPAYVRLVPHHAGVQRFFFNQYFDLYQRGVFNQLGAGVRSTLGPTDLLDLIILVPPLSEQTAIVHFLDHMNRRIRRAIRAKQKLIALLNEQKQAIIHQAVTRGLDPNVRLKPSGIEWLGDVPEHWGVVSAKQVSKVFIPQRDKPELNEREGLPWITADCVGAKNISLSGSFVSRAAAKDTGSRSVPTGSVIANCVGRFGIASINESPVVINQQLQAYTPYSDIDARFLRYCIQIAKPYFDMKGNSTTLAYVNRQGFGDMPLPQPPRSVQEAIVGAIECQEALIDKAMFDAKREISLLRDYRTRLIADVVTGKLDVRQVAARLPEEAEAPEPLDEGDDLTADDEEVEEPNFDAASEEAVA